MDIEFLRVICNKFPAVTEDIKWGNDLCFCVGTKMFCVTSLEPPFKVAFKVRDEEFEELSNSEGFIPAPYMARNKWVLVDDPTRMSKKEWEERIGTSYELISSKLTGKLKAELGIGGSAPQKPAASKPSKPKPASSKPKAVKVKTKKKVAKPSVKAKKKGSKR